MKRYSRGKIGVLVVCMMAIHVFSLFSSEGQAITVAKQENLIESLIKIPGIEGRMVMVPNKLWKKYYENGKKRAVILPTKQSPTKVFNTNAFALDPSRPYDFIEMMLKERESVKKTFNARVFVLDPLSPYVFINILFKKLESVEKGKSLVRVPWITERTIMVPEEIWKEDYKDRKNNMVAVSVVEQSYDPKSFHAWVTAPKLENYQFQARALKWVNLCDDQGVPPLHYLVEHEDAAVHHINTLVYWGADILQRSKMGMDAYRFAIAKVGQSPENEPVGNFFDDQCYANKDVMQYVFNEILLKKLSLAIEAIKKTELLGIEQRRNAEEIAALMQRADLMLLHELRKSLGLPSFWPEG